MKLLASQLFVIADRLIVIRPCTGSFKKVYGIPCHHTLRAYVAQKRVVTKEDFYKHWHYQDLPAPPQAPQPVIFAPHVVQTRGRPRDDQSTRRNPSQFEHGDRPAPARRGRPGRVGGETFTVSSITLSLTASY